MLALTQIAGLEQVIPVGKGRKRLVVVLQYQRQGFGFQPLEIGDNGQHDVTVYSKVVEDFGSRVAAVFIRDVDGSCRSGPEGELLAAIEARGVPTFCGAGFGDAVAVVKKLDMDRPLEAAKAVAEQDKSA